MMTVVNSVSKITYFIPTHTTVSIEEIRLFLYMLCQTADPSLLLSLQRSYAVCLKLRWYYSPLSICKLMNKLNRLTKSLTSTYSFL